MKKLIALNCIVLLISCKQESQVPFDDVVVIDHNEEFIETDAFEEETRQRQKFCKLNIYDLSFDNSWFYKNDTSILYLSMFSKTTPELNSSYSFSIKKVSGDFEIEEVEGQKYYQIIVGEESDFLEFDLYLFSDRYRLKSENKIIDSILLFRRRYPVEIR